WQQYPPNNNGLPFGPHPHRGFETVTFILEGDLVHKDSGHGASQIKAGGVQWMTAGKGLVHAEVSSEDFKTNGGPLEILQLWLNLPAKYKMMEPRYIGLQKEDIPTSELDDGKVIVNAVSGNWNGVKGPIDPLYDIELASINLKEGGTASFAVPKQKNILLYVVKGDVNVNDRDVTMHQLVKFGNDDESIDVKAKTDAIILFGHATPFREPFAAYGPFVMNTREEINQAYEDYNSGLFGTNDLN
ncbi:MAG TPA: pirin-like C-terminal cupin domain-containing protein, partial [Flavisolibacter sp.]